jgi:predicted DNA-binding transcriptional regulator AlpA
MCSHDMLNGWAEIAASLGCSVRTAQRWAKAGWLSVYRSRGTRRSRVYARRNEINTWREQCRPLWRAAPEQSGFGQEHTLTPHEHLWGWKAIARFMGMSVRSVQRWEGKAQLPVRRLKTGNRALPYASKADVSAWLTERTVIRPTASEIDTSQRLPALLQRFLDGLTAPMAVLDVTGTVIFVNEAWRVFGKASGYRESDFGIGASYSEVCSSVTGGDAAAATLVANGLVELLEGKRRDVQVKYRWSGPTEKREFLLCATRFDGLTSPVLVLAHYELRGVP